MYPVSYTHLDVYKRQDHAREESDYVPIYLEEIRRLKKKYEDRNIKIGNGLEVKFIDKEGNIDFNLLWARELDSLIVSFHSFPMEVYQSQGQHEFKKTWFETLRGFIKKQLIIIKQENPKLKVILGHPFSMWLKLGLFPEPVSYTHLTAVKAGAEVPFIRPPELATDDAKGIDVLFHAMDWCQKNSMNFHWVMLLQPTSPFRTPEDILNACEIMEKRQAEAVVSVCEVENHPWWCNTLPADHCMRCV